MLKDFVTRKATQQEKLKESFRKEGNSHQMEFLMNTKEMKEKRHGICMGKYMLFYYQLNLLKNMEQFNEK